MVPDMSPHGERVRALLRMQGDDPRERELIDRKVIAYGRFDTVSSGGTFLAVFQDFEAFHKPHYSLSPTTVDGHGHSRDTPPMHECAAWRFARALGPRYERLLPVTVYRSIEGHAGSLAWRLEGSHSPASALEHGLEQVYDAGFFDVLVGQQDRHLGNFLWDPVERRLGLIDHGFCFPKDLDKCTNEAPRYFAWVTEMSSLPTVR